MAGLWITLALLAAVQQPPAPLPPGPPPPHDAGERGGDRRLFISPMGEPFHTADPVRSWFDAADINHDGVLSEAEFLADADRFFTTLDRGKDGEIDPDDIEIYETEVVPEIRSGGAPLGLGGGRSGGRGRGGGGGRRGGGGGHRGGGGGGSRGAGDGEESGAATGNDAPAAAIGSYDAVARGAGRYGFFGYPEPVMSADANMNRGVDRTEFRNAARQRYAQLDKKGEGRIARGDLPKISPPPAGRGGPRGGFGGYPRRAPGGGGEQERPGHEDE